MCKEDRPIMRGDIYWAVLPDTSGENIQKGTRPVIVVQNNAGNTYSRTIIVAPITSQRKKPLPVHVEISKTGSGLPYDSIALLEQITTINKDQLTYYIGRADLETMQRIDKAIEISVF